MGRITPRAWDTNARPLDEQAELLEALENGRMGGRAHLQFDPWVVECARRAGWIGSYVYEKGAGYSLCHLTTEGLSALDRWRADD